MKVHNNIFRVVDCDNAQFQLRVRTMLNYSVIVSLPTYRAGLSCICHQQYYAAYINSGLRQSFIIMALLVFLLVGKGWGFRKLPVEKGKSDMRYRFLQSYHDDHISNRATLLLSCLVYMCWFAELALLYGHVMGAFW